MNEQNIVCFSDLDENGKRAAIALFVDGFGHMFTFAKTRDELLRLFADSFQKELVYVYLSNNMVAGFLGLGTNTKTALKGNAQVCKDLFGKGKGGIVYAQLFRRAEKPKVEKDTDLYIDFLTTSVHMRKQGIATKLLNFACALPGYTECYLDVLSKNVTAATLYESLGFVTYKKKLSIFTFVQGLGHLILMKKRVDE